MSKTAAVISTVLIGHMLVITGAHGREPLKEAADMAEVFVYGQQSKNEALLREISDPKQYEAMEKLRAQDKGEPNENVRVEGVEITDIDGDRATAKATYSKKHSKGKSQADVHLKRVDGKWQVTTPAISDSE